MKNYPMIPSFLRSAFENGPGHVSFPATSLFLDLVGFTSLSERLKVHGKEGAEILASLINTFFQPVILPIYQGDGFITNFSGDGFSSVFPYTKLSAVRQIAFDIRDQIMGINEAGRLPESVSFHIRIGIATGIIEGETISAGPETFFCFSGNAIEKAAMVASSADIDEIVCPPMTNTDEECTRPGKSDERAGTHHLSKEACLPGAHIKDFGIAEYRDAIPIFISFKGDTDREFRRALLSHIGSEAIRYGAVFNSIEFADKGPVVFLIVGAPVTREDDCSRAVSLCIELREKWGDRIRIGLTRGTAFAGRVGSSVRSHYTIVGTIVNLAARLMSSAHWGTIQSTDEFLAMISDRFEVQRTGPVQLKGFSEAVPVGLIVRPRTGETYRQSRSLIGRTSVLRHMHDMAIPWIQDSHAVMIRLSGEPGIGKSHLAWTFATSFNQQTEIFRLSADSIIRKGFNPFVSCFQTFFNVTPFGQVEVTRQQFTRVWRMMMAELSTKLEGTADENELIDELGRLESFIAAMLGLFSDDSLYAKLDSEARYRNTINAIKIFFKTRMLLHPVILFLDDLQWLDSESASAFQSLTTNIASSPLLILITTRRNDDHTIPALKTGDTLPGGDIQIEGLNEKHTADFLTVLCDGLSASRDMIDYFAARTGGNPFFIEEFWRYLKENNCLVQKEGQIYLNTRHRELPTGIRSILVARLDRLSRELRDLVQTSSVLGLEFNIVVLSTILKGASIQSLLIDGEERSIWNAVTETNYLFKHALLREAAYDMVLKSKLRQLHLIAARAMESLFPENPHFHEDIAFHYEHADHPQQAVTYLEKAYTFLCSEFKNERALRLINKACELCHDNSKKLMLLLKLVKIEYIIGNWVNAESTIRNALQSDGIDSVPELKADFLFRLGMILILTGRRDEGLEVFQSILVSGVFDNDPSMRADLFNGIGVAYRNLNQNEQARIYFLQALEIVRDTSNPVLEVKLLNSISTTYYYEQKIDDALSWLKDSKRIAEKHELLNAQCTLLANMGLILENIGDFVRARQVVDECLVLSKKCGIKYACCLATGNMARLLHVQGQYEQALHYYFQQIRQSQEMGDQWITAIALVNLGAAYEKLGKPDQAMDCYDKAEPIFRASDNDLYIGGLLQHKGELLLKKGDVTRAAEINEEAMRRCDASSYRSGMLTTRIIAAHLAARSDRSSAIDTLLALESTFDSAEERAEIQKTLYELTGSESHRKEAIRCYQQAWNMVPKAEYREYIQILEEEG